ncbi:hypothetical protein B0H10DRAFT_1946609 [Mycena sp. CBHHK59/15]|nr:hypothetical protein B0H10DRAFT_1946609 [Mycena sp. CBHHK59/15]
MFLIPSQVSLSRLRDLRGLRLNGARFAHEVNLSKLVLSHPFLYLTIRQRSTRYPAGQRRNIDRLRRDPAHNRVGKESGSQSSRNPAHNLESGRNPAQYQESEENPAHSRVGKEPSSVSSPVETSSSLNLGCNFKAELGNDESIVRGFVARRPRPPMQPASR